MKPVTISAQIAILDVIIRKGEHSLTRAGYTRGRGQAEFMLERLTAVRETLRQMEPHADELRELVRKRLKRRHDEELAKRNIPTVPTA